MGLDLEVCWVPWGPAPLERISLIPCGSALSVIIIYAVTVKRLASFQPSFLDNLMTSDLKSGRTTR